LRSAFKIVALFGGAALLAGLVGLASFRAFGQIEETAALRKQANAVLNDADDLLSALVDAESGMRGYLLTGDEAFLAPYLAVRDGVGDRLAILRQSSLTLAGHNTLHELEPLVDARMAHLARAVALRRGHEAGAAMALVGSGEGKALMDSVRAGMRSFLGAEEAELSRREAAFQERMKHLFLLIVLATLFTMLFALAFAWLVYRGTQQRVANLVHGETMHLLEIQEETNRRLQETNSALQDREEKFSVTLNSIGDAVVATDARGLVTIMNPLAEKLTGWDRAEATGRPIGEIFHIVNQETRQPSRIPVADTLAAGTIQGLANHTVLIARDGSECAIADSCAPIRDRDGRISGAVLVFRDVSVEYAAQLALRNSSALIRTILGTVADGIVTFHATGNIVETINPAAERMFGYGAAEIVGRDLGLLIPGLGTPADGLGVEVAGRRKDGSVFPVEMAASEMWLGDRRYFTGILRDITARKETEEAHRQLAQRLRDARFYTRSLFESNVDALMTTDTSGILTDVNKQMESLTGCTRDELIGAPAGNFFTDPGLAEAGIRQALGEIKLNDYELTVRGRDGKETAVSFNATTFYDRERRLKGVVASVRDVTERKRLDQAMKEKNVELETARARADKANLAKSDFLSSMSHELRSPLNAILGFAQLMESEEPPPTPSQKESIVQILQAGWHLLTLINEILDLAKVEARQVPLSEEPVSLAEVMSECRGMIEAQAQLRNVRLTFPEFDLPCFVRADRTRLKQVLLNLLSNAVKYNLENGTVEVACAGQAPGRIRVSVSDTGAGLEPDQVAQLFQAFNRLGQEAGGEEGTGIGLVVAKRLVELMGGEIGVESRVGTGSTFWFELDEADPPELSGTGVDGPPLARARAPRTDRPHTLLYVEDNPANLKLVEQIVSRHDDLRLLTAVNGIGGIEAARASLPDVILMDINLPDINGFEALKALRADPATARIPVIAISANAMPLDVGRGLKAGFFRYLTKPIRVDEFTAALDLTLESAKKAQW
jgi:PAS domain S-box-containing protein